MWQGSRRGPRSKHQSKCAMDEDNQDGEQFELVDRRRLHQTGTPPPSTTQIHHHHHHLQQQLQLQQQQQQHQTPCIHFPPPPKHPPPHSAHQHHSQHHQHHQHHHHLQQQTHQRMADDHMLSLPGPSTDYSYAYYEPGPPTRHHNVPHRYLGGPGTSRSYREGSYRSVPPACPLEVSSKSLRSKHTYLTRYGTEENIYEEISEVARARMRPIHQESMISLNQSLVEEEQRRVQHGHRRVLGELNLSVEAMLMPSSSREGSDDTETEVDDQLADLLTVGPTDDLLSPVPLVDLDSGFSGSSSGASYRSAAGSLRRGPEKNRIQTQKVQQPQPAETPSKSFWSRKAWRKLGFSSTSLNKSKEKDEPRVRSGVWEEPACERRMVPPLVHTRTLQHSASQRSSEDSWCSGSDPDLSSDEESERSGTSISRNGQIRNTLSKARTFCDKLRGSGGSGGGPRLSLDSNIPGDTSPQNAANQGRLSRWFSMRRGSTHQYDIETTGSESPTRNPSSTSNKQMPLLPEVEEESQFLNCTPQQRRLMPPTLPTAPSDLTPQQLKRRMIVAAIIHSENSYVATLHRLVNDYKKPLEESSPPILSASKISTLFHRLPEILQCHTLFRVALAESVRNWDRDEKIGDVFFASFSKSIVLDIYSGFINNFSVAMDLAKMEAKRKSALADFFKVKQISSHDRLSFFGLMVKPVQRFPQFILFLQDLLKHTPQGHHDRMSLQLALTQLESLAEMLNERKREAEQFQAFKEMLRHISGKFSSRPLCDGNRYLLREDNVTQLEFNQCGLITKAKSRRLLLLNDLVVCVAVSPRSSDDFGVSERLNLKWMFPVSDIEIQDTSASPTLSRILTAGANKSGSLKSNASFEGTQPQADNICTEMGNLMHDYEVMSRISDLVGTLRGNYKELSVENTKKILHQIQSSIQHKDEEMAWMDSCCLQLVAKSKGKEEVFTFQTDSPNVKKEWITELRLAQLALDPSNSPAWEVPEQEQRPSTKMPLFVKSQPVYKSQHESEVRCGCYYTINAPKTTRRRYKTQNYLWVCTTDGASSHISVMVQHQQQAGSLREINFFSLVETQVTAMEYVKGISQPSSALAGDSVWMGTGSRKILLYAADEPEKEQQIGSSSVPDVIVQIKYHCDNVFVALGNGMLLIYRRNPIDGTWILKDPQLRSLGSDPVSSLLPINMCMYAACGKKVCVLNGLTGEVQKDFSIQHEHVGNVNLMAHSGIGLWISLKNSSTICLYHTETFKHLQDINIASNVMRVTTSGSSSNDCMNNNRSKVNVTALLACKGLLWVGTNVGISLTIPLPRLEGVPIISGRVNISYHAHFGPISFLLALQPKNYVNCKIKELETEHDVEKLERPKMEKQLSDSSVNSVTAKLRHHLTNSPVVIRRRRSKDSELRLSKTLPRGLGNGGSKFSTSTTSSQGSGDTCDVYGLYGELMYVKDYEVDEHITDPVYESLRRSDPELAAIPAKVSTLDRRLKMKVSRPRSLDLSNWSVDSRSSSLYTSSGSEESMAIRNLGRSVSRNNSNASRQLNGVAEAVESVQAVTNLKCTNNNTKTIARNNHQVDTRRTIITLMGGKGYVNWRQPCCPADKGKHLATNPHGANNNDAHIVIWELKL
ncbi:PREDICTED: rho guanine nucleotide exchange factor 10-like protein isoform X2 [Nicrophorus vespilloides]|uniref:Rho guanine nucleotide exchange factor 10-like protein isoform X2 n=1 Tax=Nicrophorus vespilloides TaxID=110193 RepID=A0ABM1MX44_NICVS|nr:PREDICTED: rho guanine nucleotide exchange factor 10-like protein isoform X2 [Nicrophorus vespilloides]